MRASEEDTRVLLLSVCALLCVPYFPSAWFAVYSLDLSIDKKLSTSPYCQSCPVLPTFSVGMVTLSKISCPSLHFYSSYSHWLQGDEQRWRLTVFILFFCVCVCLLFQMPKMQFRSNAKPSLYAYPEPLKPPKKEEKEKVWGTSLWGKNFSPY